MKKERQLELLLFGGFDAYLHEKPLEGFSYNTMRALLAYLAVEHSRDHPREFLAELLWEGQDRTTARGNLRRTLSDLRHAIETPSGKALFTAGKHSLRFTPDLAGDLYDFVIPETSCSTETKTGCMNCLRQLEQIAGLYRGELLHGLSLPNCYQFEEWLQLQRERMHKRALTLLERVSSCHEKLGQYANALPFALHYTELEPWDETGHQRLMRLYALDGQTGAASRQYEICRQLLKSELGVMPNEVTRALARQIKQGVLRPAPRPASEGAASISLAASPVAERRQVTALYCEMTLPGGLDDDDPDGVLERLHAPQARYLEIIQQHCGHIVQTHGGGIFAYFGYPQAAEDAARRAVQAALAIGREVGDSLTLRMGIHTGLVITGAASTPDTSGKISRIASQLRHAIGPHGGIAISHVTRKIVHGYFVCNGLGLQNLPGLEQPLATFEVLRESGAQSRLDAATQLTPLVGRKREIEALVQLWQASANGQRNTLLLQGEAGIGKSRLLRTLMARLQGSTHALRELRCLPEYTHSAFYPLLAMLEEVIGFEPADTAEQKSLKLARHVEARYPDQAAEAIPLLAQLLSLPQAASYPAVTLSPRQFRERVSNILLEMVRALSAWQPLLLIIEDLHWADPSTLTLLQRHIEGSEQAAVLTLLTARPEFVPPWLDCDITRLPVLPLTRAEVKELIGAIDAGIPAVTLQHIVERADGIPLFAEELARFAARAKLGAIPGTLLDLLAARIDRLSTAKQTAQIAATIGREFSLELLYRLLANAPDAPAVRSPDISALIDAGLVSTLNASTGQFTHALIQEAVYQSQTRDRRQAAHRRIAEVLLGHFPELAEKHPEMVARHFYHGGETRAAFEYWIKAGHHARLNAAYAEALEHLQAAQRALAELPAEADRERLEFTLNLHLGATWTVAGGYGSIAAKEAYAKALKQASDLSDGAGLFAALYGAWLTECVHGGNSLALEIGEQMLQLAEQTGELIQLQVAHKCLGSSSGTVGNLHRAQFHFEQGIALYRPEHYQLMVSQYGENTRINSGVQLAMALWLRGFPGQALAQAETTLELARMELSPHMLSFALNGVALIRRWRGEPEASEPFVRECLDVATRFKLPFWQLFASTALAWVKAAQGEAGKMDALLAQLQMGDSVPAGMRLLVWHQVADGLIRLKRFGQALDKVDEIFALADNLNEQFVVSDYHRLKGVCLMELHPADQNKTEACFERSLEFSRKQGALSMELRATISLAQHWQGLGRLHDAKPLLDNICGRFTEGFETPDFRTARELLRITG